MSKVSLATQSLAIHLYMLEANVADQFEPNLAATGRVCEKLRPALLQLVGPVGYSSLISRALSLSKAENPLFLAVRVGKDGALEGFDEILISSAVQDKILDKKSAAVLIAHLLELLTTFIGESLTVSLLKDAWPNESFDKVDQRFEVKS